MDEAEELLRLTAMAVQYQGLTECNTDHAVRLVFKTMDAVKTYGKTRREG